MSYNKLVEKLLDFRSAMTTASDAGEQDVKQDGETAGIGPSVASVGAESTEDGQQEGSMNGASTAGEEAVKPARACGDDDAVVVGDNCAASGENGASPSTPANQEGSDSTLHREGTPSGACARVTSAAIADEESAKVALALNEGQVAEDFFRETASQLTYYGLARLHQEVRDVAHSYVVRSVLAVLCKKLMFSCGVDAP